MLASETLFPTENAQKFLTQICKHFSHKIPVTQDGAAGQIQFDAGTAILDAKPEGLAIRAEAADAPSVARVQSVTESHLIRFAFREEPAALVWTEAQAV
jgi:hypothetical protein